jgi:hypothetical protein
MGGGAALASLCGQEIVAYRIAMSRLVEAPLHKYPRHMNYLQILVSAALS